MRRQRWVCFAGFGALCVACTYISGVGELSVGAPPPGGPDAVGGTDGSITGDAQPEIDGAPVGIEDGAAPQDSGDAAKPPAHCPATGPGLSDCGPSAKESCCVRKAVTAGGLSYRRSYDAVTYTDGTSIASVSSFKLDRFEVTVGRFRQFVRAVVEEGWRPAAGAGKHTHLYKGRGLSAGGTTYEPGWDAGWNASLPTTYAAWKTALVTTCGPYATYTDAPTAFERRPINCETWFEAYAFCIWDGGFLPSESEWNYAAAGGGQATGQRVYPWSTPSTSTTIDCTYADYGNDTCLPKGQSDVGLLSPKGDGVFGHADLAGNIWEWTLDWYNATYPTPCADCVDLRATTERSNRGGGSFSPTNYLPTSFRGQKAPAAREDIQGFRCAVPP